jgi:epoxyqueuosine reductase
LSHHSSYPQLIKGKALELGFAACGITGIEPLAAEESVLRTWIARGDHAGMDWMKTRIPQRLDPSLLVPGAKTVISVILPYYNPVLQKDPMAPVISRYAYGLDYHHVMKKKLKALLAFVVELIPETRGRAFVDSAPVLEHAWAVRAGLGWIGRNSLLLNKEHGSYFFIGELILDQALEAGNTVVPDHCGNCRLCVNECPTHAIRDDRTVDARKCISYLTIEHKGALPASLRDSFYNRVFGCDICQDVCPWNRRLNLHSTPEILPSEELMSMDKEQWNSLNENTFNRIFAGSAVKRLGFEGLVRNIEFLAPKVEG